MAAVVDEAGVGAAAVLAEGLLDSRNMLLIWRREGCQEENFPSATAIPVANPHMPYLDDEDDVGVRHSPKKGGRISSSQVSEPAAASASNPAAHLETESAQPSDAAQVPDASTLPTTAGAQSSQASTDHPATVIQPEIPADQPVPSRAESSSTLGRGHRQRTPNVRLTDYQTYAVTHEVSNDVPDSRYPLTHSIGYAQSHCNVGDFLIGGGGGYFLTHHRCLIIRHGRGGSGFDGVEQAFADLFGIGLEDLDAFVAGSSGGSGGVESFLLNSPGECRALLRWNGSVPLRQNRRPRKRLDEAVNDGAAGPLARRPDAEGEVHRIPGSVGSGFALFRWLDL
ncbi:unnamed protein product [Cuscuta campestris]|uniref:Uncharacterized protein n=1 Tax=Cuscuta campestris TaxID=132261 RepID=A0A484MKI9_9ASTE|nr:unnamed protein product [Cuscuta campestris]